MTAEQRTAEPPSQAEPSSPAKPMGTLVNELTGMIIAYAKQETVEPLKNLGRFVAFGVAGALLLAIGGVTLTVAVVRVLQVETVPHLRGDLSWVPYAGGVLVAAFGAGWAASRIVKSPRSTR